MRKLIIQLLTIILAMLPCAARDRVYVATDRPAYAAGDLVFCSVFCAGADGSPDGYSAVCYLELVGAQGTVAEAKVGLLDGRGAGSMQIPAQVPTGNYSLVAYTARTAPEELESRRIAVYNLSSTSRSGPVVVTPEEIYRPLALVEAPCGGLRLSIPDGCVPGGEAVLGLGGLDEAADLAVSVFVDDGLVPGDGRTLAGFLSGGGCVTSAATLAGEYDGEVVHATVEGLSAGTGGEGRLRAILSTPGDPSGVYVGFTGSDGHVDFATDNIYGDRELVCEVAAMEGSACHINFSSPFRHPEPEALPPLELSPAQAGALAAMKKALAWGREARLDTLGRFLPRRRGLLLESSSRLRYHLDDYTRFPTIREVCVEIVPQLQYVKVGGRGRFRMSLDDQEGNRTLAMDNVLVMLDGVVITDHGMLEDFDAMLLEDIDIYPSAVVLGGFPFNGVVNFTTRNNSVTGMAFPGNVRVLDFHGVSYPVCYEGEVPQGEDLRRLLYWHPALELQPGRERSLRIALPPGGGRYHVVAEGWTASGRAVRAEGAVEAR